MTIDGTGWSVVLLCAIMVVGGISTYYLCRLARMTGWARPWVLFGCQLAWMIVSRFVCLGCKLEWWTLPFWTDVMTPYLSPIISSGLILAGLADMARLFNIRKNGGPK